MEIRRDTSNKLFGIIHEDPPGVQTEITMEVYFAGVLVRIVHLDRNYLRTFVINDIRFLHLNTRVVANCFVEKHEILCKINCIFVE